jgi:AcrR family transcriptional regulator
MNDERKSARATVIDAFSRLIIERRGEKPRIAEVLDEAGVARSTFYDHFEGRDDLLLAALEGPIGVLADAATGAASPARLANLLDHFRENRRGAVDILSGPLAPRVVRKLAEQLRARGAGESAATIIADQQIGLVRLWLAGEIRVTADEAASAMVKSAAALSASLS